MKKFAIFVFLILSLNFAAPASVDADFRWNDPSKYFKTDLSFESKYQLSLVAGNVGPGVNPADIKNNDIICPGATLRITPKVDATFRPKVNGIFSATYAAYTSVPTPSPSISTGNIKWISNALYSDLSPFGDSDWSKPKSQDHYNAIQPFTDEPVTYDTGPMIYPNSIGGGRVICVGSFAANDNGNPIGSNIDLSTSGSTDFTVTTPGAHSILGQLNSGAICAGALNKYPKEIPGTPGYTNSALYRLYYYKGNSPTIPNAPYTISITAQLAGGTCSVTKQGFSKDTKTIGADEHSLVNLQVRNDGTGTVKLLSVSDSSGTFTVYASDDMAVCAAFGSCSPTIIGTSMAPGETKTLLFYAKRNAGKTGDGNFVLSSQVDSGGCGTGDSCNLNFDLSVPTVSCEISPSSATMKTTETTRFTVSCKNTGAPTACTGDWSWEDGSGGFASKNSDEANVTNSAKGAHNLKYSFAGVSCISAVTVTSDDDKDKKDTCEITGPSVLYSGSTGSYAIKCINNLGANVTCPMVTWSGTATYKSQSNTGAVVEASTAGTFHIDARTTLDAKDVTCTKPFDVVKGKCVYYS